jgi:crotonobetainyl-CoA:carnitine CoA-transferase CaiB-like acyl-CoA transferase
MPANRQQAARFMELGGLPGAYESDRFLAAESSKAKVAAYYEMMEEACGAYTTAEWMDLCRAHSIPAMKANNARDILTDPQLTKTLIEERELKGQGVYRALKPPLRFAKTPTTIRRDPPDVGADNAEVFAEYGLALEDEGVAN